MFEPEASRNQKPLSTSGVGKSCKHPSFRTESRCGSKEQGHDRAVAQDLLPPHRPGIQEGRIAITTRSRRLKSAKNPRICFNGKYFLLSKRIPRAASSPVTICALASTHSPRILPR